MFLTITNWFYFLIFLHRICKRENRVFDMNSLALIFSECNLNLKRIILTSFSFRNVLTSHSNFTIVFLLKCSYLNNYTR